MDTKIINLFVYDTKDNFEKSKQFLGEEGSSFKKIICIGNIKELDMFFENNILDDDEYCYLVIHAFATNLVSGLKRFVTSGIPKKYPKLGHMYISDGVETEIKHLMLDAKIEDEPVYKYHEVYSNLNDGRVTVYTKKQINEYSEDSPRNCKGDTGFASPSLYPQCDYAIITALEEDEMEKVLPMITKIDSISNNKHLIEYGFLTSNKEKTIAYASQQSTGMIDAAILATELLLRFQPKFLIMVGVLGGKPNEVNIGDIVVATRAFTIDKGKLSDYGFKRELESSNTDNAFITKFRREKKDITNYIKNCDPTRKSNLQIHFGSIACVRQVIDLDGFFEEKVSNVDRKALALEMESYGIARACELVNNGQTVPLIIKAAMDNTIDKDDNAKAYASWTSAMFVKYILENDLL